ncbi:hypothetical protein HA402_013756 [Bradysia odoriphaga]|nr:hypothetical protein HA402_013756 [Bradysia odoriphaga]
MTKNILDLHEDFLLQIFKRCNLETQAELSDTCKLFKDILHRNVFPKIQTCAICIESASDRYAMLKIQRCVGPYVVDLKIKIWDEDHPFLDAYFKMLGRHLGSNLRKLTLNGVRMEMNLLEPIRPALERLTELRQLHISGHSIGELAPLCPVLEKLSFQPFKPCKLSPVTWPSLKSVSFKYFELRLKTFCQFIKLNPQLTDLEVAVEDSSWLKMISAYLPNLEALAFHECSEYFVSKEDMLPLLRLTKLTKLSLPSPSNDSLFRRRESEYGLKGFLQCLTKFNKLIEIKFNDNFNHSENVSPKLFGKVANGLPFLEVFHFPLFNPRPRALVEFVRFAKCLREIYIGLENDDFDDDDDVDEEVWINDLIAARKSHQPEDAEPLKFLIEVGCSIDSIIKKIDCGKYLCASAPPK